MTDWTDSNPYIQKILTSLDLANATCETRAEYMAILLHIQDVVKDELKACRVNELKEKTDSNTKN